MKGVGGNIQNTNFQHDSDNVKGCSKRRHPCTARLDGLNRDILWHNKGIWQSTYQCLYRCHFGPRSMWQLADSGEPIGLPARAYLLPLYTVPGMHHAVKVRYGVDNPGEVGSTAVFPPSWIRINSVHKVANATLQYIHTQTDATKHITLLRKCTQGNNVERN